jgi:hypothetical protein
VRCRERLELVGNDLEERRALTCRTGEVLVRERPDGHLLDSDPNAPVEELVELVGAGSMPG